MSKDKINGETPTTKMTTKTKPDRAIKLSRVVFIAALEGARGHPKKIIDGQQGVTETTYHPDLGTITFVSKDGTKYNCPLTNVGFFVVKED